jgi:hypothetical protein
MLEMILKFVFLIITAILAGWGVFHDYKTANEINKHGYVAIGAVVILCLASIWIEVSTKTKAEKSAKLASEQQEIEDAQRNLLIKNIKEVDGRVNANIKYLEKLKKDLLTNYSAIKLSENNLKKVSNLQLSQQKELDKEIKEFSEIARLELKRLSSPVKELYFSSSFKFIDSKKTFNHYYNFLKPEFYYSEGNYSNSVDQEKSTPQNLNLSNAHYFYPDYLQLGFYKNVNQPISIDKVREVNPDLLLIIEDAHNEKPFSDMYSNLDDASIIKKLTLRPLLVKTTNGDITSTLDITDLAKPGDYVTFSFTSTYPENVEVKQVTLHTKKSREIGINLTECRLLERQSSLKYIRSESVEINHFRYTYACKLWMSNKLPL